MGWSHGEEVFDDVARTVIETGAPAEIQRAILGKLIDRLRHVDWDTADESLREFRDNQLIIELFRERGITADCGDQGGPEHADECTRMLGHDGDHVDDQDYSWPQTAREA